MGVIMIPAAFHVDDGQGTADSQPGRGGVRVHIEHLVLEGLPFDAVQARRLQASLVEAMTRRLTEDPTVVTRLSRPLPTPGSIRLPATTTPELAGLAIARALFQDGPGIHQPSVASPSSTVESVPRNS